MLKIKSQNGSNEVTRTPTTTKKVNSSPTGPRPPLEQFGDMKIEFLQDSCANQKEWSVS